MLIVLLLISIGITTWGYIASKNNEDRFVDVGFIRMICGGTSILIIVVAMLCVIGNVISASCIPQKIEMYSTENAYIQQEISVMVSNYMDYENKTFSDIKTESPVTLVTIFPELKSNELVNTQINIYVENNNSIKALKEKQISASIYKWWLYFGR